MMAAATSVAQRLAPFVDAGLFDADTLAFTDELLTIVEAIDAPAEVLLAAALTVRAPGQGHVCVDLTRVAKQVAVDAGAPLPWPEPAQWCEALATQPSLVQLADAIDGAPQRPLVLDGTRLYLARLWSDERDVADQLRALADGRLRVVTGGPGSGKTTRIAHALRALLHERPALRVALAAPTGKAAARMREALAGVLQHAQADTDELARFDVLRAVTLHTLLGLRPGRIEAHDAPAAPPLDADLVIIDEVSMVSLPLLARVLAALAPHAALWLVGDPGQLASVEAGCVLADIVQAPASTPGGALHGAMEHLGSQYRFGLGSGIGRLAAALRSGDAEAALTTLRAGTDDVQWVDPEAGDGAARMASLKAAIAAHAQGVATIARRGDGAAALHGMLALRTLCAHRDGDWGVSGWNRHVEQALLLRGGDLWYLGRPLLITRNDHGLDLMNGELGVVVASASGPRAVFPGRDGALRAIHPVRLGAVDTVHAMTIHKSQGSEFDHVVVVLPPAASRLLTRELLYTAVTRARTRVTVVGDEAAVRAGVARVAARASGLVARLA